jgi:phage shock protein A
MADQPTHTEQGQIERAQRLREKINRMKEGGPAADESSSQPEARPKSIKEQIEERTAKNKKPAP